MKKKNLFILCCLFITSFAFAQPIILNLGQPSNPTSFPLNADNVWTETYNENDYPYIEFNNSAFKFTHLGAGEGDSWGGMYWDGFTYSKNGDNTDYGTNSMEWVSHQWGNMAAGGIKTDAEGNVLKDDNGVVLTDLNLPYLLAYWGFVGYTLPPLSVLFNDVYEAEGVYVNNSPWPYYGNIHGDGFAEAFTQEGDYFKLFIHGLNENHQDNGKKVEYYLAKFENGALIQSPNWEWIDLTALGEVSGIYFSMESTDFSSYGMNTAAYFCMDRLQIREPEQTIAVTGVELNRDTLSLEEAESFNLIATVLPTNATNQNVTWASSDNNVATVDEDGLVTAIVKGTATITVTTEEGEHTAECEVTVTEKVGIDTYQKDMCKVYPTVTTGLVYIVLPENITEVVQITDISGRILQTLRLQALENTIDISSYQCGLYMIKIGKQVVKVVKQ